MNTFEKRQLSFENLVRKGEQFLAEQAPLRADPLNKGEYRDLLVLAFVLEALQSNDAVVYKAFLLGHDPLPEMEIDFAKIHPWTLNWYLQRLT